MLVVGAERELTRQVRNLLARCRPEAAHVVGAPALEPRWSGCSERPRIIFLGVGLPELGNLNMLVRLQAAAPGVPVVPLPVISRRPRPQAPWWPFRARRAIDRNEVVGLLQQLALMDEGAREMFYLATHDRLTGLANRWLLEERLAHAIARSRRTQPSGALLFIDLDDFKAINDRHGHEVGDRMLAFAAERLLHRCGPRTRSHAGAATSSRSSWRASAIAIRPTPRGASWCSAWRSRPRRSASLRASVGVALFPDDGQDVATLMAQADRRMYRAKGRRVLWSVFRRG